MFMYYAGAVLVVLVRDRNLIKLTTMRGVVMFIMLGSTMLCRCKAKNHVTLNILCDMRCVCARPL